MVEETPWQQALRYANRTNPYPFYEELRKTPVARQPDGTYVVSTYREIVTLLHDPRVSSDPRKCPVPTAAPTEGSVEAEAEPITEAVISLEPNIITQDPPEHDRDRRMMMPHFVGPPHSPHLISDLEPEIHRIVAGLLDDMRGKTRIDAVDDFAYPLPVTVICKVLGVPLEDEPRFHHWIETALDALDFGPEARPGGEAGRGQSTGMNLRRADRVTERGRAVGPLDIAPAAKRMEALSGREQIE
ncbi:hypothetical protein QRN89_00595 [Streptomyces chengbuensis]|uniref:hypothetical protein n=1 Tax=Streptomyces TaxID=1883 RepID=UPI0025B43790|nr:hypothetical protein [Streptomyces sp. HUAS CB01]WJY48430.1 hypothetical protein QRN89_00595 [Streptomyces sp. HUAS CB01]